MRYLLFLLVFPVFLSQKQATTTLSGRVLDSEIPNEGLFGATIKVLKGTDILGGAVTDLDGYFSLNLASGTYDVEISYTGYMTERIEQVKVLENQTNKILDVIMQTSASLEEVVVTAYKVPILQADQTSGGQTLTSDQIRNLPTRSVNAIVATTSGTQSSKDKKVKIKGNRSNATNYYVDGVRVSADAVQVDKKPEHTKKQAKKAEKQRQKELEKPKTPSPTDPTTAGESYNKIVENDFISAEKEAISTFSIDVDAASYSNVRRMLNYNQLPQKDAVRIEELINYFPYNYTAPTNGEPFAVHTELAACPWKKENRLLRVGLKGQNMDLGQLPPSNFVFLLDVSGSMNAENKLPLVKKSLALLSSQLRAIDRVSIVVYAGAAGLVLPPTKGNDQSAILAAFEKLQAGGSTAGGAGIELAYKTARENFNKNGNNRVILCTDGDFNVGVSSQGGLDQLIEKERESGIYLTVLGFGMGNYQDGKMQSLADKGNGNHAYIDSEKEAKKVLVKEFGGTMYAIAKDVKLQLIFNPAAVKSYRLIGYENRLLATEDFDDDKKDAGELGVGHTVTALYEIEPVHNDRLHENLLTLKLRYKNPQKGKDKSSKLIEHHLAEQPSQTPSADFHLAASVAEFGMLLRDSKYKGSATWANLKKQTEIFSKTDAKNELLQELSLLVNKAEALSTVK